MDEILVIDDEPMIRSIVETLLSRRGYSVVCAGTVEEAVGLFNREGANYRALITDYNLEDGTGVDIVNVIKKKAAGIPVVLMTGSAEMTRTASDEAGFFAYFRKPFNVMELGRKIDSLVNRGNKTDEVSSSCLEAVQ